jgi:Legionella pneumophila major outer membrane protein precursor
LRDFLGATKIKKTGAVVKKILVGVFAVGTALTSGVAFAGQIDDVLTRLDAIEKENSAIRKENTALLENKRLREQNAKLKSSSAEPHNAEPHNAEPQYAPTPAIASVAPAPTRPAPLGPISQAIEDVRSDLFGAAKSDPFGAYAADLPVQYKAHVESPGQLRLWGEGGAIWTGGDPVTQPFTLINFNSFFLGPGATGIPGSFDLTPKIGWEGATGFDYRFPDSLWHVSAQFRYGEGGKTSGLASSSGVIDPLFIAALAAGGGFVIGLPGALTGAGGSESFGTSYKETHWLADLAVGRDVLGSGANALQLKGGLRVSEFVAKQTTTNSANLFVNFTPTAIFPGGPVISSISNSTSSVSDQRQAFLGAGPLIGIDGAVPFAGKWSLDYTGDAAVLFGTQKSTGTTTITSSTTPAFFSGVAGFGGFSGINTFSNERFGTVFSADIQVGISYWITENIKLGASYRLDAMINVQNQDTTPVTNLTPDRYTHGPRVKLTGQF